MEERNPGLCVTFVDRERRNIYMECNGCPITLVFSKEPNEEIRDSLQQILIGSVINQSKSQSCVSA